MNLRIWIWLFSIALSVMACSRTFGLEQYHYLVQSEQELRSALKDPKGLAQDELVIKISASLSDIRRPFVYAKDADLHLCGDQHTIASHGRCRVLHIRSPGLVTINGLIIANGRTGVQASRGGGIYHQSGDLKIIDSVFVDNGTQWGGAVYANGRVEVFNSTFASNSARWTGGAIYSMQGISSTNSRYTNNTEPSLYVADNQ